MADTYDDENTDQKAESTLKESELHKPEADTGLEQENQIQLAEGIDWSPLKKFGTFCLSGLLYACKLALSYSIPILASFTLFFLHSGTLFLERIAEFLFTIPKFDPPIKPDGSANDLYDEKLSTYLKLFSDGLVLILIKLFLFLFALTSYVFVFAKRKLKKDMLEEIDTAFDTRMQATFSPVSTTITNVKTGLDTGLSNVKVGVDEAFTTVETGIKSGLTDVDAGIQKLQGLVSSPLEKEKIKIGIFNRLLAYSPLFVAENLGYFDDENLDVEIVIEGSDAEVAKELRAGNIDFGLCDPIFALQNENVKLDNLRILMPMVKRLDVTAICDADLLDDLKNKKLTIACFSSPSTTHSAAMLLCKELKDLGAKEVTLKEISSRDVRFGDRSGVIKLIKEHSIALLWNPASSWAIDTFAKNNSGEYGILYCKWGDAESRSSLNNWSVLPITTNHYASDKPISKNDHQPWVPTRQKKISNKLLAAGMLVREDRSSYRPDLNQKVFKALSRAFNRMTGADWVHEARHEEDDKPNLVSLIANEVNNNEGVDSQIIKNLIKRKDSMKSMFPFIYSLKNYDPKTYSKHLKHLRELWSHDVEFSKDLDTTENKSPASYRSYFVDLKND